MEEHVKDIAGEERAAIIAWIKRNPGTSPQSAWVDCAEYIVAQLEQGAHNYDE